MSQEKEKKPNNRRYRIITVSGIFNCKEKGEIVFPPATFNKRNIKAIEGNEPNSGNNMVRIKAGKDSKILKKFEKAKENGVIELGPLVARKSQTPDDDMSK